MSLDPKGYYARLEIAPWAARDAIHAAYRRKARLLHPDIPVTGNADAFVAMKEAYEVLADPLRRAAYDREARSNTRTRSEPVDDAEEIIPDPPAPVPPFEFRHPRISDLPLVLWLVLGGVMILAAFEAILHLTALPPIEHTAVIPASAPYVQPATPPPPPTPVRLAGTPNAYVMPAGGPAVVWRHDDRRGAYVPIGELPPFSAVQVVRVPRKKGLLAVRLEDHKVGFIEASRLTPGNAEAAHQAYCAYNAGAVPDNAEVLARNGSGPADISVVNHSSEPAVVKLRTAAGVVAATVYLAPFGVAHVRGLPTGPYQPEFAIGEMWSRTCGSFAAGMQAQRFADATNISALSPLDIPGDGTNRSATLDIPDQEFNRP